jgi:hypothetical protein
MLRDRLPLDGRSYAESVRELERLIRGTPDLSNLADIRAFLSTAPPSLMASGRQKSAWRRTMRSSGSLSTT